MDTARVRIAFGLWWRLRPGRWYLLIAMPIAVVGFFALLTSIVVAPEAPWLDRALDAYVPVLVFFIALSWIEMWVKAWRAAGDPTPSKGPRNPAMPPSVPEP